MQRIAINVKIGDLGSAAMELELIIGGFELIVEGVLEHPGEDRLHGGN